MARLRAQHQQKSPPELPIVQLAGQLPPQERLSPIIGPIVQDFSESCVEAIAPVLQNLQQRIGQVVGEQMEQALPLIRIELRRQPLQEARETGLPRDGDRTRQPRRNEVREGSDMRGDTHQPDMGGRQVAAYDQHRPTRIEPTNLADLLERVLDKGIVIAGDITLSLGTIELLTLKIRLLIASVDKAQQIGIDWWKSDPALSSHARRQQLEDRIERLEARLGGENQAGTLEDHRDPLEQRLERLESGLGAPAQEEQPGSDER